MYISHSGHIRTVFIPSVLKRTVKRVAKNILKLQKRLKFDAIAFRGASGAGIAYPVSMLTGIHLVYVRKESTHGLEIEGPRDEVKRYIILDDFMESGSTVKAIISKIEHWSDVGDTLPECVGICFYSYVGGTNRIFEYDGKDYYTYRKKDYEVIKV